MITRSSKLHLKYANKNKMSGFSFLFNEVTSNMLVELTNNFIYSSKILSLPPKDITSKLPFSARVSQLVAKECSSVARSIKTKIDKINKNGNLQKYQQEILDKFKNKELLVKTISQFNLDSRFVDIQRSEDSSFDYWIKITFPTHKPFFLPFNKTKHIEKLISRGYELKTSTLRIKRNGEIELFFYKEEKQNNNSETIGIDVGRNKAFVTSRNEKENDIRQMLLNLKAKKHGSKNKQSHIRKIKQTIDYSIKNNVDWSNIKIIILENLVGMKPSKKWGQINHHWSYSYIQNRIKLLAEELDVQVKLIHPAYTSQTCSGCGKTHKNNRLKEDFLCVFCGLEIDADYNAAINIRNKGNIAP